MIMRARAAADAIVHPLGEHIILVGGVEVERPASHQCRMMAKRSNNGTSRCCATQRMPSA